MLSTRNALLVLFLGLMFVPVDVAADSPGVAVGYSARDQQTVGATNNRCAVDALGGAHVAWTVGGISDKNAYYNFINEAGEATFGNGTRINPNVGGGYPSVTINSQNAASIGYYNYSHLILTLAVDAGQGMGIFSIFDPPDNVPAGSPTFWPEIAIDNSGNYHFLSIEHGMETITVPMIYSHSENSAQDWVGPFVIDTIGVPAYLMAASRYDDKVSIVYAKPRNLVNADYYNNDVVYIESLDGVTWDFDAKINITNYALQDTLRCFNSLDAVYDPDGNLHIVWTTPFYDELSQLATSDTCLLWHWSEATGAGIIAEGLNPSTPGTWNLSISSCNISVSDAGDLYVSYSRFNNQDVSSAGFSNGDIFYTFSIDNGQFWFPDENLTNSVTNGCAPGTCDNDMQLATADYVDNALHLFFIDDKDAGMVGAGEGEETNNPQMYLRYGVSVGVDEGNNEYVPGKFYLSCSYPNPFNASTNLGYEIVEAGLVRIDIYNIAGQIVRTLVNGNHQPGHYVVNFNAEELSSGIYYARLTSGGENFTRKLTLLK